MMDVRVTNALDAAAAADAVTRSAIVTGGGDSTDVWRRVLGQTLTDGESVRVLQEHGRKGNFLGALQACDRLRGEDGALRAIEQLVMFVGAGSRLSPVTQALHNMKAALRLPSGHEGSGTLTVGEAAVRSSAPWIRALRAGGFDGIVIRWGDEIMIPSTDLTARAGEFADVDAVRFGYYARPTELLASQKEWLLTDERGDVYAELPRQPLERLLGHVSRYRSVKALHVNLGSFAISYDLLDALGQAFGDLIGPDDVAANWDPYVWMALHSSTRIEWEADCRGGRSEVPRDFAELVEAIPDFWRRVQSAKSALAERTGRAFASRVFDFGDPYWFDAGNHAALRGGLGDVFGSGRDGETLRAFLGLPEGLSRGASLIRDSRIEPGAEIRNSIVIDSTVSHAESFAERSIVLSSELGRLRADPGSVVIECACPMLEVDGPEGFAIRLDSSAHVRGDEVTAGLRTPDGPLRLSHFGPSVIVDGERYESRLWANPISFKAASDLVAQTCAEQS